MDSLQVIDGQIKSMWGKSAPDVIAAEMGLQRSTVVRRAKAMGLALPVKSTVKSADRPRRKRKSRSEATVAVEADAPVMKGEPRRPPDEPVSESFTVLVRPATPDSRRLADLDAMGCRFPLGESPADNMAAQLFCNSPAEPKSSYCCKHHNIVWRPAPNVRKS